MKIPKVENCCFCINLRTGALILGWLGTIGGSILTISSILGLIYFDTTQHREYDLLDHLKHLKQQGNDVDEQIQAVKTMIEMLPIAYISLWIETFCCSLAVISSILLLIGVMRHRLMFVKQWPIASGIFLVIGIIYQVVVICMSPASMQQLMIISYLVTDVFSIGKINTFFSVKKT